MRYPECPWSSAEDALPEFEERTGETEAGAFLEEELREIELTGCGDEVVAQLHEDGRVESRQCRQGRPQRRIETAVRHAHDLHCGNVRPGVGADQLVGAGGGLDAGLVCAARPREQREGELAGEFAGRSRFRGFALKPRDGELGRREPVGEGRALLLQGG